MKTALLIISLLFLNICSQSQDQSGRRLSISDFEKTITPQMGYDTIISRFGVPDTNTGSGIYILIYNLVDSTSIIIGCDNTRILYARSRDRNGVVRDIIPINQTEPNKKKLRNKKPKHNRSVYAIGFPYRENLLAKEERLVDGGTARPGTAGGSRRCHGFCQRENKLLTA